MDKEKILLFIPVYNCASQIPRVLSQMSNEVLSHISEVLVVDNRSSDQTVKAATEGLIKLGDAVPCKLIRNTKNYSLGGSIKIAFQYCLSNNFDFMITLHGDDQADIRDVLPVLNSKLHHNFDFLIGSRFQKDSVLKDYSTIRILGNRLFMFAASLVTRCRVEDLVAGLNIYKKEFIEKHFFWTFPDNLTFDFHTLLYAIRSKSKIFFFPICWREYDQVSNAKLVQQGLILIRLLINYALGRNTLCQTSAQGENLAHFYTYEVLLSNGPA